VWVHKPGSFAAEDVVEVTRELAVAIADQEWTRRRSFRQDPRELASLLGEDREAQPAEFADDPLVASARILVREA
jgi:hypothetical protein